MEIHSGQIIDAAPSVQEEIKTFHFEENVPFPQEKKKILALLCQKYVIISCTQHHNME